MKWTKETLWAVLEVNDDQLARALVALYNRQTEDEKETKETTAQNNLGFNAIDSAFMTSIAQAYIRFGRLSERQIFTVRKSIKKYCRQLVDIANSK